MKTIPIVTILITILASAEAVSQQQAEARFKKAGIKWTSSGNCKDKSNPKCTSFDGLRENTVAGAVTLKGACDCDITITGGTETGHAGGAKSHGNGYKLDFKKNSVLDGYVKKSFAKIDDRGDGYPQWKSKAGNIYCDEKNHWDVVYV